MLQSYPHREGLLKSDEVDWLVLTPYGDSYEWFHSLPIRRKDEANETQAKMPLSMIGRSRSFNPSVYFSVYSLCVEDLMPCSSQFNEYTSTAYLASHSRLPLAFSVTSKTLDGSTIGALVIYSEVSHVVHAHLRDWPPLFEGVL